MLRRGVSVLVVLVCVLHLCSHACGEMQYGGDYRVQLWGFVKSGTTYTSTMIGRAIGLIYDVPGSAHVSKQELLAVEDFPLCPVSLQDGMLSDQHCCVWWALVEHCRDAQHRRVMPRFSLDKHGEFTRICDSAPYRGQPDCSAYTGYTHLPLSSSARQTDRHLMLVRDPRDVVVSWFYYLAYNKKVLNTNATPQLPWLRMLIENHPTSMTQIIPHTMRRQQASRVLFRNVLDRGWTIDRSEVAPVVLYLVDMVASFYIENYHQLRVAQHFRVTYYQDMDEHAERELREVLAFLGFADVNPALIEAVVEYSSMSAMKERERKRSEELGNLDVHNVAAHTRGGTGSKEIGYKVEGLITPDVNNPDSYKSRKGGSGGYKDELSREALLLVEEYYQRKLTLVRNPLWKYVNGTRVSH